MVNWQDPGVQINLGLSVVKLQHVFFGLYIWEFLTNLHFDFSLFYPTRRLGWVKWLYLAARFLTLATVINDVVGLDIGSAVDCKPQVVLNCALSTLSTQAGSVLIAVRVFAVWNRYILIFIISVVGILAQIGILIYSMNHINAEEWGGLVTNCPFSPHDLAPISTALLTFDIILLSLLIIGLFRSRCAGRFGLWRYLWHQGWLWLGMACLAGVPPVTIIFLNFNNELDTMLLLPQVIASSIASMRMYRSLYTFSMHDTVDSSQIPSFVAIEMKKRRSARDTLDKSTSHAASAPRSDVFGQYTAISYVP